MCGVSSRATEGPVLPSFCLLSVAFTSSSFFQLANPFPARTSAWSSFLGTKSPRFNETFLSEPLLQYHRLTPRVHAVPTLLG